MNIWNHHHHPPKNDDVCKYTKSFSRQPDHNQLEAPGTNLTNQDRLQTASQKQNNFAEDVSHLRRLVFEKAHYFTTDRQTKHLSIPHSKQMFFKESHYYLNYVIFDGQTNRCKQVSMHCRRNSRKRASTTYQFKFTYREVKSAIELFVRPCLTAKLLMRLSYHVGDDYKWVVFYFWGLQT